MNNLQDRLTTYLLARLPRKLAIGVMAFFIALTYTVATTIFVVVMVVLGKAAIDNPILLLCYFGVGVFVIALAIIANHISSEYPTRKEKDTDDAPAATEPPPPEPKPAANPPGYTLR